jgi:hypothetical protein
MYRTFELLGTFEMKALESEAPARANARPSSKTSSSASSPAA